MVKSRRKPREPRRRDFSALSSSTTESSVFKLPAPLPSSNERVFVTDTKSVQHQQAGEGRAGHEGPLKQAIFKICSKHPDPRLEDVLEFLQGFIDESLPEKFMDEFHRPESPIPINPQEITPPDWQQHSQRALLTMKEARLSYRSLDGTQADCSIKTIANYVTEYRRSTR